MKNFFRLFESRFFSGESAAYDWSFDKEPKVKGDFNTEILTL